MCHSKQQSILLEHGEGGKGGQEPPVCSECKRNLADGGEPAKGSSERHDVTGKVGDCRKLLPQRETERVRIGVGAQVSRGRELWSVPQHPSSGSVEDSPDCIVAHAEEETEVIPLGEYSACSPVNRNLPRHKVGA